jgi:hypothetical protein
LDLGVLILKEDIQYPRRDLKLIVSAREKRPGTAGVFTLKRTTSSVAKRNCTAKIIEMVKTGSTE